MLFKIFVFFVVPAILAQQYTFPMSYGFPQVQNADRFAYNNNPPQNFFAPNSAPPKSTYTFNPMARIQVQPPIFAPNSNFGANSGEFQVDQRKPEILPPKMTPEGPTRIIPPFLKGADIVEQDKFYAIVQHPTWSGAEKNQKIEELMKSMSEDRQEEYSEYRNTIHVDLARRQKSVASAVEAMSPEAFGEFQKVVEIMRDVSLTESAKIQKLEKIYSSLPAKIRQEFDEKLKGF
ncbi:unnamed protein product [Caenorhabditis angaria]|uniref:SXP/RAL-2 family protein Ani s 5-like cation-binding domain-containing protein n=1 Tax=Caenorhabditis angaria TaxID=860376 RepID=A0A9P1IDB9_9PELO|nr:unnamed protein product [Caenorhabditis angaria]